MPTPTTFGIFDSAAQVRFGMGSLPRPTFIPELLEGDGGEDEDVRPAYLVLAVDHGVVGAGVLRDALLRLGQQLLAGAAHRRLGRAGLGASGRLAFALPRSMQPSHLRTDAESASTTRSAAR